MYPLGLSSTDQYHSDTITALHDLLASHGASWNILASSLIECPMVKTLRTVSEALPSGASLPRRRSKSELTIPERAAAASLQGRLRANNRRGRRKGKKHQGAGKKTSASP
jgi:hypothetical protein